ncbi:outer membrane protein assembly factor BamB family protein [Microtetraspora niveoalba]|uniref:outer membrane protein assembly factor BamB family protein n=1 Tax=Microtetraspora niveoalba TaxID=46175 RepID=UPI000A060DAF|nr:PQQ-binding-like beta-propeller repeat protein [Microtetraspora niveoalba]
MNEPAPQGRHDRNAICLGGPCHGLLTHVDQDVGILTVPVPRRSPDEPEWRAGYRITGERCATRGMPPRTSPCTGPTRTPPPAPAGPRLHVGDPADVLVVRRRPWRRPEAGQVLFGWQEEDAVYAATAGRTVHRLAKSDGRVEAVYRCDGPVYSCATSLEGRYVFAGDSHSSVYCFAASGERLWKLGTGCGSAFSMQFLDDRLYIVTTDGSLACIDASETAIAAARAGTVPEPVDVKAAASLPVVEPSVVLETVSHAGDGVVVECVREGERLRVRVASPGYETWNVQFPKDIREAGARYLVEDVRSSGRGGFYRTYGEIRRLL